MPPRIVWRDKAIRAAAQGATFDRMQKAVIMTRDQIKVLINRGNRRGDNPSAPGEPPKKVSGRLFKAVTSRVVYRDGQVVGLIGADVPYEPRLELGFYGTDSRGRVYRQAPRPGFRIGLQMSLPALRRIFGIHVKTGGA